MPTSFSSIFQSIYSADVMPASASLVINQLLGFVTVMMTSFFDCCLHFMLCFRFLALKWLRLVGSTPGCKAAMILSICSLRETSKKVTPIVRLSLLLLVSSPFPVPLSFCELYFANWPFCIVYFHSLDFLVATVMGMCFSVWPRAIYCSW